MNLWFSTLHHHPTCRAGSLLVFTRILSWLTITGTFGFGVTLQLQVISSFLFTLEQGGNPDRLLKYFIQHRGVQLLLSFLPLKSINREARMEVLEFLTRLSEVNLTLKQALCSLNTHEAVATVMIEHGDPAILQRGHELLVALGQANPRHSMKILDALIRICAHNKASNEARFYALLATKRVSLNAEGLLEACANDTKREELIPKVVAVAVSLLVSPEPGIKKMAEDLLREVRSLPDADLTILQELSSASLHFMGSVSATAAEANAKARREAAARADELAKLSDNMRAIRLEQLEAQDRAKAAAAAVAAAEKARATGDDSSTQGKRLEDMSWEERQKMLDEMDAQDKNDMDTSFEHQRKAVKVFGIIGQSLYIEALMLYVQENKRKDSALRTTSLCSRRSSSSSSGQMAAANMKMGQSNTIPKNPVDLRTKDASSPSSSPRRGLSQLGLGQFMHQKSRFSVHGAIPEGDAEGDNINDNNNNNSGKSDNHYHYAEGVKTQRRQAEGAELLPLPTATVDPEPAAETAEGLLDGSVTNNESHTPAESPDGGGGGVMVTMVEMDIMPPRERTTSLLPPHGDENDPSRTSTENKSAQRAKNMIRRAGREAGADVREFARLSYPAVRGLSTRDPPAISSATWMFDKESKTVGKHNEQLLRYPTPALGDKHQNHYSYPDSERVDSSDEETGNNEKEQRPKMTRRKYALDPSASAACDVDSEDVRNLTRDWLREAMGATHIYNLSRYDLKQWNKFGVDSPGLHAGETTLALGACRSRIGLFDGDHPRQEPPRAHTTAPFPVHSRPRSASFLAATCGEKKKNEEDEKKPEGETAAAQRLEEEGILYDPMEGRIGRMQPERHRLAKLKSRGAWSNPVPSVNRGPGSDHNRQRGKEWYHSEKGPCYRPFPIWQGSSDSHARDYTCTSGNTLSNGFRPPVIDDIVEYYDKGVWALADNFPDLPDLDRLSELDPEDVEYLESEVSDMVELMERQGHGDWLRWEEDQRDQTLTQKSEDNNQPVDEAIASRRERPDSSLTQVHAPYRPESAHSRGSTRPGTARTTTNVGHGFLSAYKPMIQAHENAVGSPAVASPRDPCTRAGDIQALTAKEEIQTRGTPMESIGDGPQEIARAAREREEEEEKKEAEEEDKDKEGGGYVWFHGLRGQTPSPPRKRQLVDTFALSKMGVDVVRDVATGMLSLSPGGQGKSNKDRTLNKPVSPFSEASAQIQSRHPICASLRGSGRNPSRSPSPSRRNPDDPGQGGQGGFCGRSTSPSRPGSPGSENLQGLASFAKARHWWESGDIAGSLFTYEEITKQSGASSLRGRANKDYYEAAAAERRGGVRVPTEKSGLALQRLLSSSLRFRDGIEMMTARYARVSDSSGSLGSTQAFSEAQGMEDNIGDLLDVSSLSSSDDDEVDGEDGEARDHFVDRKVRYGLIEPLGIHRLDQRLGFREELDNCVLTKATTRAERRSSTLIGWEKDVEEMKRARLRDGLDARHLTLQLTQQADKLVGQSASRKVINLFKEASRRQLGPTSATTTPSSPEGKRTGRGMFKVDKLAGFRGGGLGLGGGGGALSYPETIDPMEAKRKVVQQAFDYLVSRRSIGAIIACLGNRLYPKGQIQAAETLRILMQIHTPVQQIVSDMLSEDVARDLCTLPAVVAVGKMHPDLIESCGRICFELIREEAAERSAKSFSS